MFLFLTFSSQSTAAGSLNYPQNPITSCNEGIESNIWYHYLYTDLAVLSQLDAQSLEYYSSLLHNSVPNGMTVYSFNQMLCNIRDYMRDPRSKEQFLQMIQAMHETIGAEQVDICVQHLFNSCAIFKKSSRAFFDKYNELHNAFAHATAENAGCEHGIENAKNSLVNSCGTLNGNADEGKKVFMPSVADNQDEFSNTAENTSSYISKARPFRLIPSSAKWKTEPGEEPSYESKKMHRIAVENFKTLSYEEYGAINNVRGPVLRKRKSDEEDPSGHKHPKTQ